VAKAHQIPTRTLHRAQLRYPPALAECAPAAGYTGAMPDRAVLVGPRAGFEGEALPERFVLVGHSGGGQLVGGAAGYFEEFAPDAEDHNLAGVILLRHLADRRSD